MIIFCILVLATCAIFIHPAYRRLITVFFIYMFVSFAFRIQETSYIVLFYCINQCVHNDVFDSVDGAEVQFDYKHSNCPFHWLTGQFVCNDVTVLWLLHHWTVCRICDWHHLSAYLLVFLYTVYDCCVLCCHGSVRFGTSVYYNVVAPSSLHCVLVFLFSSFDCVFIRLLCRGFLHAQLH